MNRKSRKLTLAAVIVISVFIAGFIVPNRVDSKLVTNVPSDISGEEMRALVIEDFENTSIGETGWDVRSTPRQVKGSDSEKEGKGKMKNPVPTLELKIVEGSPSSLIPEEFSITTKGKTKSKCLGIHFVFRYPGYNSVSLLPPLEVDWKDKNKAAFTFDPSNNSNTQERAIQLPGRSRAISLWVHARGRPYTLEVWIKDYVGNTHVLHLGTIDFVGWKPMKVYIPANIPQSESSYPSTRITKLTKFVIRSKANAVPGDTYVFLDQIKVLTDTYEVNFDGQELHNAFEKGSDGDKSGGTKKTEK